MAQAVFKRRGNVHKANVLQNKAVQSQPCPEYVCVHYWHRISPAQLPLSASPLMKGELGPARVGFLSHGPVTTDCDLWMHTRDPGGRTAQLSPANYNLITLSFSFRRIKTLGWFSAELWILPGELSSSLTQSITNSVCDSDPTITTGFALCNASGKELSQMSPLLYLVPPAQPLSRRQKQLDSQVRFWINKI